MAVESTPGEVGQKLVGYDFISGPVFDVASREQRAGLHIATLAATIFDAEGLVPSTLREMDMIVGGDAKLGRIIGKDALFVPKPPKKDRPDVNVLDLYDIATRARYDLTMLTQLAAELKSKKDSTLTADDVVLKRRDGIPQLVRHHDHRLLIARQAIKYAPFVMKPDRDTRLADPYTTPIESTKQGREARLTLVMGSMGVTKAIQLSESAIKVQSAREMYWNKKVAAREEELERKKAAKSRGKDEQLTLYDVA